MPAKKKTPFVSPYVFAKSTFWVREPGSKYPTMVEQGRAWWSDSPMVLNNPDNFTDVPPDVQPRGWQSKVEQATAAPGEVRNSGRGNG